MRIDSFPVTFMGTIFREMDQNLRNFIPAKINSLNPKTAGRSGFDPLPPTLWFFENMSSKDTFATFCDFLTFNIIIISHIIPENFIEVPEVLHKR